MYFCVLYQNRQGICHSYYIYGLQLRTTSMRSSHCFLKPKRGRVIRNSSARWENETSRLSELQQQSQKTKTSLPVSVNYTRVAYILAESKIEIGSTSTGLYDAVSQKAITFIHRRVHGYWINSETFQSTSHLHDICLPNIVQNYLPVYT